MNASKVSNEGLASILRAMAVTGVSPTSDEREYLFEAADRLEDEDEEDDV